MCTPAPLLFIVLLRSATAEPGHDADKRIVNPRPRIISGRDGRPRLDADVYSGATGPPFGESAAEESPRPSRIAGNFPKPRRPLLAPSPARLAGFTFVAGSEL